ncbi:MAG: uncharacterized protein KVP18_000671 [Porospora cf. gigantea A]|uniref:uncharacterized protein n=1 Tax=Porospora cf. gigantea A TaxID=2853593 RepID=UPI00355A71DC|nr:MAG: hypothetical protein KVP18_000671 [Porospora cf. gigantea A]
MRSVVDTARLAVFACALILESLVRNLIVGVYRCVPCKRLLDVVRRRCSWIRTVFSNQLNSGGDRPECFWSTRELLACVGLDTEEVHAETADGFRLVLHRLRGREGGPPVLLVHGVLMSSEAYVAIPHRSLAVELHSRGYDVWLGNNRGNKYSWRHRHLSRNDREYWNFSVDELATFDIPTMVNAVIESTGKVQLSYVGFSNGTAQMFAAASTQPELQKKLSCFIAISPVCKLDAINHAAETYGLLYPLLKSNRSSFLTLFGHKAFISVVDTWKRMLTPHTFVFLLDCFLELLFGWQVDSTKAPFQDRCMFYYHLYSTTSVKVIQHWFQQTGTAFQHFSDTYNLGDISIPRYDLRNVEVPVTLIHGGLDRLCDMNWMLEELTECDVRRICVPHYYHLDSLFYTDAPKEIFPVIFDELRRRACKFSSFVHGGSSVTLDVCDSRKVHGCLVACADKLEHAVYRWIAVVLTVEEGWATPEQEAVKALDAVLEAVEDLHRLCPCKSYWSAVQTSVNHVLLAIGRLTSTIGSLKQNAQSKDRLSPLTGAVQESLLNLRSIPIHAYQNFTMTLVRMAHHMKAALSDLGPYTPPDDSTEASTPPEIDDDPLLVVGDEALLPEMVPLKEDLELVLSETHQWLMAFLKAWVTEVKNAGGQIPSTLRQVDALHAMFEEMASLVDRLCFDVLSSDVEEFPKDFSEFKALTLQINEIKLDPLFKTSTFPQLIVELTRTTTESDI